MNRPGTRPEIEGKIVKIVARHARGNPYSLYLFGSRAKGENSPQSDYDIGFLGNLPLTLSTASRIREELEALPILQEIDFVDLKKTSPAFRRSVLTSGKLLDER